jgi:hypothetical protein
MNIPQCHKSYIIDCGEEVIVKRRLPGKYVEGHYVPGDLTECGYMMSVQPLTGYEILQLEEADRTREHIKAYAVDEIRVNDYLCYRCKHYEVQSVKQRSKSHHFKAIARLVDIDVVEGKGLGN